MAYGTKYTSQFYDLSGTTWTVNLKKTGYTGSTSNITYYSLSPLLINYIGDREENPVVCGSEANFSFYYVSGDTTNEFLAIDNYNDWQLEVKKAGNLYWIGYLRPDNVSFKYLGNYFINLTAICGLNNFSQIDYPVSPTIASSRTEGINILKYCLDTNGISLDITSQLNTYENSLMVSGTSTLGNVIFSQKRFQEDQDGRSVNLKCYDVLTYLLKSFSSKIFQSNGKWVIVNSNEVLSRKHTYTYSSLALSTANYDRTLNLSSSKFLFGSDELSKISPYRKYEVSYRNKSIDDTILFNSDFTTNINGWYNSTGSSATQFRAVTWSSANNNSLTLSAAPVLNNPNADHYVFCDKFYLEPRGTTTLALEWKTIASIAFSGSTNMPKFRLDLIQPDGTTQTGSETLLTTSLHTYTQSFSVWETGLYFIKLWIVPNPALSQIISYTINVDYVTGIPHYSTDATFDEYVNGTVTTNVKEVGEEIYFADGQLSNDVGNLKVGSYLTTNWNSYGGVENLPLQRLLIYQRLKQYLKFKDYFKLTVRSSDILFENLLVINSKKYNIISMNYDVLNCTTELELEEFLETNPTVTYVQTTLSTIDGE